MGTEAIHRGVRIDIDVEPMPGGWRAIATVHTRLGSFVPALLASQAVPFPTEEEAVEYALARAREAIDLVVAGRPPDEPSASSPAP